MRPFYLLQKVVPAFCEEFRKLFLAYGLTFITFLHAGGRWEEFLREGHIHCTGSRGSRVLGTALLSVRDAHINALPDDGLNRGLLGMSETGREDAERLGIGRTEKTASLDWLSTQILGSISPCSGCLGASASTSPSSPSTAYLQGAKFNYNPQKPGGPSNVYHSNFVANLRIRVGV